MKVIFLQDVPNVARAGEVKEVASGYGRNFLIPKKLALLAGSPASITQLKIKVQSQADTQAELVRLAQQLESKEIILKARVGAKDRLFGSITSADIASELNNSSGLVIDKRKVELAEPIRQLGTYEVAIKLAKDIIPKIKVTVTEKETD
jgi:large subunit ribosomal protein L9